MPDASNYSAVEHLRDGRPITIRALQPDDRDALLAAVEGSSTQSLYLRFFAVKRHFSEKEIDHFVNIDFVSHVALVAVLGDEPRTIIGGGRYAMVRNGAAEVAFAVVDEYQGQGLGRLLMRHLATIARAAGIAEFVAEVLPANRPMLKVFENSGLPMRTAREGGVVHVSLRLSD